MKRRPDMIALGVVALAGGSAVIAAFASATARPAVSAETFQQLDLFGEVFETIHESYVAEADNAALIEGAIEGMMSGLEPHSSYLNAEDYKEMQEVTRAEYEGLGLSVIMENEGPDSGLVKVVALTEGTPAAKAGVQPNDLIVAVDGESVRELTYSNAVSRMKGPKGTSVEISVIRDREKPAFSLTLVRDDIHVATVTSSAKGDIGYFRVRRFTENATEELLAGLKTLNEAASKPKGYILDLRGNPGGLFDQAVSMADSFLESGEIVSTRGRNPRENSRAIAKPGDIAQGRPLIVLIDAGSASASEIVAGALQDHGRALLVGERSFGKGITQAVIPLRNGLSGAMVLTTARYYTPSGRSIQAFGVAPDVAIAPIAEGEDAPARLRERDLARALDAERAAAPADEVPPQRCETGEDCVLDFALGLLNDQTTFKSKLQQAQAQRRAEAFGKPT